MLRKPKNLPNHKNTFSSGNLQIDYTIHSIDYCTVQFPYHAQLERASIQKPPRFVLQSLGHFNCMGLQFCTQKCTDVMTVSAPRIHFFQLISSILCWYRPVLRVYWSTMPLGLPASGQSHIHVYTYTYIVPHNYCQMW